MIASGSKIEITDRIAIFLETGKIQKPIWNSLKSVKKIFGRKKLRFK